MPKHKTLWMTDPLVNQEGHPEAWSGAELTHTATGLYLGFWGGWDTGTIELSDQDARALQSVLNELFPA